MAKKRLLKELPTAAFALVLAGGVLILIGGFVASMISTNVPFTVMMMGAGPYYYSGWGVAAGLIGIICGIMVIVSAAALRTRDANKLTTWAIVALVASSVSVISSGGFIVGFVLALAGSVLGLMHGSDGF